MPEGEIFSLQWANAKEVTKIEDFGLYTDPGNKTGFTGSIIRAVFTVELEYHRFPFDKQLLNMTLQAPTSLPRSSVYFITKAQLNPNLQKHNLWDVANVTSESRSKPFVESRDYSSSSDPRYSVAQATFTIHLKRQVTYYLYNYIILEIVLCVLGLTSLFIPAESIDGRLGIGLTLVLAINVFQVVLVENMPSTGYLTDMHAFTIYNTILLAGVCGESIIVYAAMKRVEAKQRIMGSVKALNCRKDVANAAATRIAAVARGHFVRKQLGRWRRKAVSSKRARFSLTRVSRVAEPASDLAPRVAATLGAESVAVRIGSVDTTSPVSGCEGSKASASSIHIPTQDVTIHRHTNARVSMGRLDDRGRELLLSGRDVHERVHSRFRMLQRRAGDAVAEWVVDNLDNWSLFLFPVALAAIAVFSFPGWR